MEAIDPELWRQAALIHREAIVVDTHCDTPGLLLEGSFDLDRRNVSGAVDFVRMKEGGLDASFFAAFVPNQLDDQGATRRALELIDAIHQEVGKHPDLASLAFSAQDIRNLHRQGKRAIVVSMENGGPLEGSLRLLRGFYRLGVRALALTHNENNGLCDSATAGKPRWGGLSPFGREVVREMNRLGMIVDVSHLSDLSVRAAVELSIAPVMASHSCARALCPIPRNLPDDLIQAIAGKGGVVQINFFSGFLDAATAARMKELEPMIKAEIEALQEKFREDHGAYEDAARAIWQRHELPAAPIEALIDHIDHVAAIAGVDAVGLGSDFDGIPSTPQGLGDASGLPLITYHLLKRGRPAADIAKILGGNTLRLLDRVAEAAAG